MRKVWCQPRSSAQLQVDHPRKLTKNVANTVSWVAQLAGGRAPAGHRTPPSFPSSRSRDSAAALAPCSPGELRPLRAQLFLRYWLRGLRSSVPPPVSLSHSTSQGIALWSAPGGHPKALERFKALARADSCSWQCTLSGLIWRQCSQPQRRAAVLGLKLNSTQDDAC